MSNKIIYAKVRLELDVEENISVDNIMADIDYDFIFEGEEAVVLDTEIMDWHEKE